MLKKFNIIVAIDEDYGIGKNGNIPWKDIKDLQNFSKITIGNGNNAVIMGYKTYKSLPDNMRPLPKRKNFILTRSNNSSFEGFKCLSIIDALKCCLSYDEIFIIGGQSVYEECIEKYIYLCDKI